jgi:hypothetical protein
MTMPYGNVANASSERRHRVQHATRRQVIKKTREDPRVNRRLVVRQYSWSAGGEIEISRLKEDIALLRGIGPQILSSAVSSFSAHTASLPSPRT